MESLISVIIPVYNSEKYLRQCVESVQRQTYRNLELCWSMTDQRIVPLKFVSN